MKPVTENSLRNLAIKWTAIGVLTIALAAACIGYGLAARSRGACIGDTSRDIIARHVKGFKLDGQIVSAQAIPITSRIPWPFIVDVYYDVPWGMHVAHGRNRYMVLPWVSKRVSHETELIL
jgi:hypothetical protein